MNSIWDILDLADINGRIDNNPLFDQVNRSDLASFCYRGWLMQEEDYGLHSKFGTRYRFTITREGQRAIERHRSDLGYRPVQVQVDPVDELIRTAKSEDRHQWDLSMIPDEKIVPRITAAIAQLLATDDKMSGNEIAFNHPPTEIPSNWTGFGDRGSDIANLAAVAALIHQEIRDRLDAHEKPKTEMKMHLDLNSKMPISWVGPNVRPPVFAFDWSRE